MRPLLCSVFCLRTTRLIKSHPSHSLFYSRSLLCFDCIALLCAHGIITVKVKVESRWWEETVAIQQLLCIRHSKTKTSRLGCTVSWLPLSTHSLSLPVSQHTPLLSALSLFHISNRFPRVSVFHLVFNPYSFSYSFSSPLVWGALMFLSGTSVFSSVVLSLRLLFCFPVQSCHSHR